MRNFFLFGALCLLIAIFAPHVIHLGPVDLNARSFYWPAGFLIAEGFLFLLYVKVGKFRHRDFMLSLHSWRGDEQVLDVGCGRGLLLAGAAKRIAALSGTGHATGIDVWSNVDMGGNSAAATQHNLELEGISNLCTLLSEPAQDDVLPRRHLRRHRLQSLHPQHLRRAHPPPSTPADRPRPQTRRHRPHLRLQTHRRIRKGVQLRRLIVEKRRGSLLTTFPPLTVVIARKPM